MHGDEQRGIGRCGLRCDAPSSNSRVPGRSSDWLDLRPVTPEVAGSGPLGPSRLKHSCAATSRRFYFEAARSVKTTRTRFRTRYESSEVEEHTE